MKKSPCTLRGLINPDVMLDHGRVGVGVGCLRWYAGLTTALALQTASCVEIDEQKTPIQPQTVSNGALWSVESKRNTTNRIGILTQSGNHLGEPTELGDPRSGVRLSISLVGAPSVVQEVVGNAIRYRTDGFAEFDWVEHRPFMSSFEDWYHYAAKPAREYLVFRLTLGEKASGIRQVGTGRPDESVLEILDRDGAPRLRMSPPFVLENNSGRRISALASVSGCQVDRSEQPPWKRPVVAPGSSECTLTISWEGKDVQYPAELDPLWNTSGNLAEPRTYQVATVLGTGDALLCGGASNSGYLASCEMFDPDSNSWGSVAPLPVPMGAMEGVMLSDGRWMLAGGGGSSPALGQYYADVAYFFDPVASQWTTGAAIQYPRYNHTLTRLPDNRVLIAGGSGNQGDRLQAEIYDPNTDSWTPAGLLPSGRTRHTSTVLPDGRVLMVGGEPSSGLPYLEALVYTPLSLTWSGAGTTASSRLYHTTLLLPDGRVGVFGGISNNTPLSLVEVFDGSTNQWSSLPSSPAPRGIHAAVTLQDGRIVLVGGTSTGYNTVANADIVTFPAATWGSAGTLVKPRLRHSALVLLDGRVLVAGGEDFNGYIAETEIMEYLSLGENCLGDFECLAGHCVEGVCCDSACANRKCTTIDTGLPTGTCGPIIQGRPCSANSQCGSGNCVDGVCCDSSCSSGCFACSALAKTYGVDGECAPVAVGIQNGDCQYSDPSTCGNDGACDGLGGCRKHATGTQCAPASCSAELHHEPSYCNGLGTCIAGDASGCAPGFGCLGASCNTTCVNDVECLTGYYCASPNCISSHPDGENCETNRQCVSGHCVDGICCDSACASSCQVCKISDGASGNGVCSIAPPGYAGKPDCGIFACDGVGGGCPTSCVSDSSCDEAYYCASGGFCLLRKPLGNQCSLLAGADCKVGGCRVCESGYCVDQVCCEQQCGGACEACTVAGDCLPLGDGTSPKTPCSNGILCDGTHTACPTSCNGDDDCGAAGYCDTGACNAKKSLGADCQESRECLASPNSPQSYCADGVCCDGPCDGTCEACSHATKETGSSGTCGAALSGTNPRNLCVQHSGNDTCGTVSKCASDGTCALEAQTTSCGSNTCSGTFLSGSFCNGLGECLESSTPVDCSPYRCVTDACTNPCTTDDDCVTGYRCLSNGLCTAKKQPGEGCTIPAECELGFCVDGVCCDSACTGQCEYCATTATKGQCKALSLGQPQGGREECGGKGTTCGGECKGDATSCTYPSQGTTCSNGDLCDGDSAFSGLQCDGAGQCIGKSPKICAPFTCDPDNGKCKTACVTTADCSEGATCSSSGLCTLGEATCSNKTTIKQSDGSLIDCAPYICQVGQCTATCSNGSDCASSASCANGQCVDNGGEGGQSGSGGASGASNSAAPKDDGGCGCRVVQSRAYDWEVLGAIGVVVAAIGRRRNRYLRSA